LNGRGIVADVSDFNKKEYCFMWEHFRKVYYKIYAKYFHKLAIPIPRILLETVRKIYRVYRNSRKCRKLDQMNC
jgi:hypothetical protein